MIYGAHAVAPMTSKERDLLRLIVRVYGVLGEAPSQRSLARRLGITLPRVQRMLADLCRKGWLRVPDPSGIRCGHCQEP